MQPDLLENFNQRVLIVLEQHNVCSLFDIFAGVDRLTDYTMYNEPLVYKSSKIGMLFLTVIFMITFKKCLKLIICADDLYVFFLFNNNNAVLETGI